MTLQEYTEYYNEIFIPAYADAVALLADKPEQLIIEQENSLSHLIPYLDDNNDITNLRRAKGHLERATLDAYKMTWVELKKKLMYYVSLDKSNVAVAFNLPVDEVLKDLSLFDTNIQEARLLEARNIGKGNVDVSEKYLNSILIAMKLLDSVDDDNVRSYQKHTFFDYIQKHSIGFGLGIVASLLATWIIT